MDSYSLDSLARYLQRAHLRKRFGRGVAHRLIGGQTADPPMADHSLERKRLWGTLPDLRDSGQTVTGTVTGRMSGNA